MRLYAVLDTNVIVSALITKNPDAPPRKVFLAMLNGQITPLIHPDILAEYREVLNRKKFHLRKETVQLVLNAIQAYGVEVEPQATGAVLPDMDDLIFYEVAMEKQNCDAHLVTGNLKHYPAKKFIVSPAEMVLLLAEEG